MSGAFGCPVGPGFPWLSGWEEFSERTVQNQGGPEDSRSVPRAVAQKGVVTVRDS